MASPPKKKSSFRRHWKFIRPHRRMLVFVLLALTFEMAFIDGISVAVGYLIDHALLGEGDATVVTQVLVGLGIGALLVAGIGTWRDYSYARIGSAVLTEVRLEMFTRLQRLSMNFYARQEVGQILARFSGDIAEVEQALELILTDAIMPAMSVVLTTGLLFWFDWRLALLTQLIWPLMLVGPRYLAPKVSKATRDLKAAEGDAMTVLHQNVGTQTVVKAFGLYTGTLKEFVRLCKDLAQLMVRARFFAESVERTATTGILILQVLLLAGGSYLVLHQIMSVGELFTFQGLFVGLSASMTELTRYFPTMLEAGAGADRIEELLEEKPQVDDRPDAIECPPIKQGIVFNDVCFSYQPQRNSLVHVSFTIPRGTSVAIVGASGSGKSTAMKLLSRFYDPDTGTVEVDGRDVRTMTQDSLRARMTYVFQDSYLFNTSVRENIRIGKLTSSDEEVEIAAKRAEIDEYVRSLPQGYDTSVGERGFNLSSGQRQRIAIARAMMRDAEILALDEATSALDPATEAAINNTLSRIGRGRTVVSITHRLSTVTTYDKIIVMDNGRMMEEGTHEELLALNGIYSHLWRKQSGFEVSDDGEYAAVTVERLGAMPIFEALNEELLNDVARYVVTELVPPGRHVMNEGDMGDLLYIIVRGSVEVSKIGPDGESHRVAVLQDGDHFGEVALLHPVPRTATVKTLVPCIFLTLKRSRFLRLLDRAPQLRTSLEQIFHQRIQDELRGAQAPVSNQ